MQNLTPEQLEIATRTEGIFYPHSARARKKMIETNGRFAHYTTAENALKIINSKRVWMRNTTCMSDYREVNHGFDALNRYFNNPPSKEKFNAAINACSPGAAEEAIGLFNQWWQNTQLQTYITSISEHDSSEDQHGRLSMWRAFGGPAIPRVALVIKIPLELTSANPALNATLSPVGYLTDKEVGDELDSIILNIQSNQDFVYKQGRQYLVGNVFMFLLMATVCMKHDGFREEREWRIVYSPKRTPSTIMETSIEVISGIPQQVYKIPLENNSSASITGISIADLLDRVIIGPTQFPWVLYEAFVAVLDAAGIKDASSKVSVSQIPVRT
ncbi:MAG: DUF2971 domain-containing protein [Xanthobacteraceae bacterium]